MEMISQDIETLRELAAKFEPGRNESGLANDMFEAAADWQNFGEEILDSPPESGWDVSERMQQEVELFDDLRAYYGKALDENADYAKVMAVGARLIAIAKQLKPHPDGPLGVFRIGREIFAFLQSEFGLVPGQTTRTKLDYSSDGVCVKIHYPTQYDSACRIIDLANPTLHENPFSLEDLLFMDGRSVSLKLPPGQAIKTEDDVRAWFTTVADVLRRHGTGVLAGQPEAFARLAAAAKERERLYVEECERFYGSGIPKASDAV